MDERHEGEIREDTLFSKDDTDSGKDRKAELK